MLAIKKDGKGLNISNKLFCFVKAQAFSSPAVIESIGVNPIVKSIKSVIVKKPTKPIKIFFLANLAP